jgi:hypothetical protein
MPRRRRTSRLPFVLCLLFLAGSIPATSACDVLTGACCRVCTKGKACGDSCIAKNETCRVGAGCACNG